MSPGLAVCGVGISARATAESAAREAAGRAMAHASARLPGGELCDPIGGLLFQARGGAMLGAASSGVSRESGAPRVLAASPGESGHVLAMGTVLEQGCAVMLLWADGAEVVSNSGEDAFGGSLAIALGASTPVGVGLRERAQPGLAGLELSEGGAIALDGERVATGAAGWTVGGAGRLDAFAAQGCEPFGRSMVVTKGKRNLVLELDGEAALTRVRAQAATLTDSQRRLLGGGIGGGLAFGIVLDASKARHGRGDHLIRRVVGLDEGSGAIALEDKAPEGTTIRLHLRSPDTAQADLEMLLDLEGMRGPAAGAVVLAAEGAPVGELEARGRAVMRSMRAELPAEQKAKIGEVAGEGVDSPPVIGITGPAQIGPLAGVPRRHTHATVVGLFRGA